MDAQFWGTAPACRSPKSQSLSKWTIPENNICCKYIRLFQNNAYKCNMNTQFVFKIHIFTHRILYCMEIKDG